MQTRPAAHLAEYSLPAALAAAGLADVSAAPRGARARRSLQDAASQSGARPPAAQAREIRRLRLDDARSSGPVGRRELFGDFLASPAMVDAVQRREISEIAQLEPNQRIVQIGLELLRADLR